MIHNCEFTKEMFEDLGTGKCSSLVLIPTTEIVVGDIVAVNEIEEPTIIELEDPEDLESLNPYNAPPRSYTGRCCVLDVTYVQKLSGTGHTIVSVRPCDVVTYSKGVSRIFGDYREGTGNE